MKPMILFVFVSMLPFQSACSANDEPSHKIYIDDGGAVGDEVRLCAACPTFVKVPKSDKFGRTIKYVAAHELTWANYLASVDDGACPVPASFVEAWPIEPVRERMISRYKIDWPAAYLSMSEIDCYSSWIGKETGLTASLPSPKEWEWFASAGDQTLKFPWGESYKNPPAAVDGVEIKVNDRWPADFQGYGDRELVSGVRVGIFPPNDWGLYDLIGNTPELTTKTQTGEQYISERPKLSKFEAWKRYDWILIKGAGTSFDYWRDGITFENWTYIDEGRPQAPTSVRLVLIEPEL